MALLPPAPHCVWCKTLCLQTAGGNLERPYLDLCLGNAHAPAAAPAYMWLEWHPYLEIPDFVTLRYVRDFERRDRVCCPMLRQSCSSASLWLSSLHGCRALGRYTLLPH